MADDDDEDDDNDGYVPVAEALQECGLSLAQLRALVQAGFVAKRVEGGKTLYCLADLSRLAGMPKREEEAPADQPAVLTEFRALAEGYKSLLDLALKQTKQAQDHERQLIASFSKPLEHLGESSKGLVSAVLDQNKQLIQRANDGDMARLDLVKATEGILKDQRAEFREIAENDRKHQLKLEVWEGVKKAAPHLLAGFKETIGTDRIEAAEKLKEKLNPDKVAALVAFGLVDSEELDLLCTAFGYDRADLEARAAAARAMKDEPEAVQ